jgi:hypothetical protein
VRLEGTSFLRFRNAGEEQEKEVEYTEQEQVNFPGTLNNCRNR